MAKKGKQEEDSGGGIPAWMATYSDLISLLMVFFVLLYAMSSIDVEKWNQLAASFNPNYTESFFSGAGGNIIGDMAGQGFFEFPVPPSGRPEPGEPGSGPELGDNEIIIDLEGIESLDQFLELLQYYMDIRGMYFPDGVGPLLPPDYKPGDGLTDPGVEPGKPGETAKPGEPGDGPTGVETGENVVILDYGDVSIEGGDFQLKLTLGNNVSFDSGKYDMKDLKPDARQWIDFIVETIDKYDMNYMIRIEGHTDNVSIKTPECEDNFDLSYRRAKTVKNYIIEKFGFSEYIFELQGRGELFPIADNNTPDGKAQNRRVEIYIIFEPIAQVPAQTPETPDELPEQIPEQEQ